MVRGSTVLLMQDYQIVSFLPNTIDGVLRIVHYMHSIPKFCKSCFDPHLPMKRIDADHRKTPHLIRFIFPGGQDRFFRKLCGLGFRQAFAFGSVRLDLDLLMTLRAGESEDTALG